MMSHMSEQKQNLPAQFFFFLPSISSLFAAGSGTFLEIQLTARRERKEVLQPHYDSTPWVNIWKL